MKEGHASTNAATAAAIAHPEEKRHCLALKKKTT